MTLQKLLLFVCLLAGAAFSAQAQPDNDPVLFTVDGQPVRVSEFRYIYAKTNQDKADFSDKSLREYLDLYSTFKLKVHKARDMQLDTVQALREELAGYRRQLANSYLVDKEVTEKLIREAYDRMGQDVDISHIFVAVDRNAKAADTLRAYNRVTGLLKMIQNGAAFEQVAIDSSDDKSAKENRGNLGYVTAMLPDGYYSLEKAAYTGPSGVVLGPIRSNSGYHLLRINGKRPARGKMEVAHILFRKGDSEEKNVAIKQRADSVYMALQKGGNWDDLATKYSDDRMTAGKKGYLGVFGINQYQRSFEDAAFALQKDGDFSAPSETSIGWHIIKRIGQRPLGPFDVEKRALTERVKRDSRSEEAKQSMIARIKRESKFEEYPAVFQQWLSKQKDTVFLTFKWKPDPVKPQDVMLRFGAKTYTVADFEDFCARASRDRMRGAGTPLDEVAQKLYKNWSDDVAMQFEESQLDQKYPDFRALMREYEEGILLFEALKQNVWDRANTDSTGLQQYFDTNLKSKYMWGERARVSIYTIKSDDPKVVEKVRKMAAEKPAAAVLKKFNKKGDVVNVLEKIYEKGKNKDLGDAWTAGALTATKPDAGTKTATFLKIEEILPPMPKQLSEARGYAVADYQDYLEKKWVEELRAAYKVVVDEAVLKSLVLRP